MFVAQLEKVGIFSPLYNRPDMARALLCQIMCQTRQPDLLVFHQNGCAENFSWVIEDLSPDFEVVWLHSPERLPQHQWYLKPLELLLARECDVFFWMDQDDQYYANHVEVALKDLSEADFRVSCKVDILYLHKMQFKRVKDCNFTVHAPGGMSSSMAFNRAFARQLQEDLANDKDHYYSDQVLANLTLPRFKKHLSDVKTTAYVCHEGTVSSQPAFKQFLDEHGSA